jgi:DNA-binding MarR family transcriptional regulator
MAQFSLSAFLPYQLAVAASSVSKELAEIYGARWDISTTEWRVLAHLSQIDEPVSLREVCKRVDLEKSKVSRATSRLKKRGLVLKSTQNSDRRLIQLSLTPNGQGLVAEIIPVVLAYERDLISRLTDADEFRGQLSLVGKE